MREKRWAILLAMCLAVVIAPAAMAQTFQFPDNTLIVPYSGGSPTGGGAVDIIGSSSFATTQVNVVLTGQDVTFQIFSNYPLAGETVSGLFVPMADLAIDLDSNGTYEHAIVLTSHGTSPVFGQGLWNNVSWDTSNDLFASHTAFTYGGKTVSPNDFIDTQITGGTGPSALASLTTHSQTNTVGSETTFTRYDVDLGNVNASGDWNNFSFLFGTGTCANDALLGTVSTSVPEPAALLLLGLGLLGLAGLRRRFGR